MEVNMCYLLAESKKTTIVMLLKKAAIRDISICNGWRDILMVASVVLENPTAVFWEDAVPLPATYGDIREDNEGI